MAASAGAVEGEVLPPTRGGRTRQPITWAPAAGDENGDPGALSAVGGPRSAAGRLPDVALSVLGKAGVRKVLKSKVTVGGGKVDVDVGSRAAFPEPSAAGQGGQGDSRPDSSTGGPPPTHTSSSRREAKEAIRAPGARPKPLSVVVAPPPEQQRRRSVSRRERGGSGGPGAGVVRCPVCGFRFKIQYTRQACRWVSTLAVLSP